MITTLGVDTYETDDVPVDYAWAKEQGIKPALYRCVPYEAAQHDTARLAQAEARVAYFSKLLASFWRITPPDIKVPDGRTFEFIDPDPHRTLRVIRDAMTGAMAQLEVQQQLDPEAHARAILKATACDWLWIEAGAQVAELDGSFTLEQLEAVATLLRLGKKYTVEEHQV